MDNQIRLFKVLGIPIKLDYSWFIIFLLITWTLAGGYFPQHYPDLTTTAYWIMGIVASLFLFFSVLFHELCHSYVAKRSGIPIRGITLFIFGGVAEITKEPPDPKTEFKVAVAGPLSSFFLSAIFFATSALAGRYALNPSIGAVLTYLGLINVILGGFNLIPGFPLDGGRVLRALLWHRSGDLRRATYVSSRIGGGFGLFLIIIGVFNVFSGDFISGIWFVFIGFFLRQAAEGGYRQVLLKQSLTGIFIKDLMISEVVSIQEDTPVDVAVEEYFFKYRYDGFPVVSDKKIRGLISLENIKALPKEQWSITRVGDVMDRDLDKLCIRPGEEAVNALAKMIKEGAGRLLVVENGDLLGLITRRDILQLFKIKTDLGE